MIKLPHVLYDIGITLNAKGDAEKMFSKEYTEQMAWWLDFFRLTENGICNYIHKK